MPFYNIYKYIIAKLNFSNILCYRPSITFFDVKRHLVTLSKGLETGGVDRGIMNKNIRPVFLFNEPISFFFTKPLYCPVCQNANLLFLKSFHNDPKLEVATLAKRIILQSENDPQHSRAIIFCGLENKT